jgi:hypothetical protein
MLGLHCATTIPDNRNIERRHPPASRSGINRANSSWSLSIATAFRTFWM